MAQTVKNLPPVEKTQIRSLGWENLLEKGMATHPSILAGKFHRERSLAGCSPWVHKESDTSELLTLSLQASSNNKQKQVLKNGTNELICKTETDSQI